MQPENRISTITYILDSLNAPVYRRKQVLEGIYRQYISSYADLTVLPKEIRQALENGLGTQVLSINPVQEIHDNQANKVLFETKEHNRFEAVLMTFRPNESRSEEHQSLCLSSQSGCALGCTFCATGAIGLKQNLSADEITDQALYFLQQKRIVKNIAFMGMGEPFANPSLFDALKVLTDKDKMAYSPRRISISTVGIIPGIKRLQKEFPNINLAFSLHTPFQEQRLQLMPVTKTYPIVDVMHALQEFVGSTNKRVFIAYVLLAGVNDSVDHAKELAKLIMRQGAKSYLYHVNLIRFNPGTTFKRFAAPETAQIELFQSILESRGITTTLRQSFGTEINAACGQLYAKYAKSRAHRL